MTSLDPTDADADKIAAFLGHGIDAALVERIRGTPASRRHLARLLTARLSDCAPANVEQAAAFDLDADGVVDLVSRVGIVWHADVIARTIEIDARRTLVESIGEDNYALALSAVRGGVPTPRVSMPSESLSGAAVREGESCLAAWRDSQPKPVADRLRLTWPDAEPAPIHHRYALAIVDWLLGGPLVQ